MFPYLLPGGIKTVSTHSTDDLMQRHMILMARYEEIEPKPTTNQLQPEAGPSRFAVAQFKNTRQSSLLVGLNVETLNHTRNFTLPLIIVTSVRSTFSFLRICTVEGSACLIFH